MDKKTIDFLEKYKKLKNKIDEDYKKIVKSNNSEKEILTKVEECLSEYSKKKLELNQLYGQHGVIIQKEIVLSDITRGISSHERKFLLLSVALEKIENGSCNKCKQKTTLNNYYVYLWKERKIRKWAIDRVFDFSFEDFERHVPIFCSENCFKQSYWSSKPNNNKKNDASNQQTPKKNRICWECHKTKSEKWFINQETGLEFCSQKCNLEHNAELCENCVQKCLKYEKGKAVEYQSYYKDSEKKTGVLCFKCKQKQKKEWEEELKRLEKEQSEDKDELERLKSLIDSSDINLDKNQESRIKNQESRIKNQESRIKNQESRIKNQESRINLTLSTPTQSNP